MNCALFATMDQIFSLKKQNIKKNTGKMAQNTGKVREFCQSGKVGTLTLVQRLSHWTESVGKLKVMENENVEID